MASSLKTDAELISACLAGDLHPWDQLIARYSGFIYALALRSGLSHADAEDVFQNVCLSLYQNLGSLRNVDRLSTWLSITTRNEVASFYRKRRTILASEMSDTPGETAGAYRVGGEASPGPEEIALALEEQHLVYECLQHLPEECRRLLTLLYIEDPPRSYIEIAKRLSLPMGSIGPKRARCLQRLEKLLKKFGC